MLKLNVYNTHQLPRLKSIDLSVSAKDLHGKRYVSGEEWLIPGGCWRVMQGGGRVVWGCHWLAAG